MSTSFDWDVFLSHSSVDRPRVARLAERLKAAGFRVWFDHPHIDGGKDIVTAIEQGLERSRVLVLCMTKAAFKSEWVRLELTTAMFRDPGNHDRRFLPLRLDDCQIPATLRRLKCIDWQSESDTSWQQLLAALQPAALYPEVKTLMRNTPSRTRTVFAIFAAMLGTTITFLVVQGLPQKGIGLGDRPVEHEDSPATTVPPRPEPLEQTEVKRYRVKHSSVAYLMDGMTNNPIIVGAEEIGVRQNTSRDKKSYQLFFEGRQQLLWIDIRSVEPVEIAKPN